MLKIAMLLFVALACGAQDVVSITGSWHGKIMIPPNMELGIEVRFTPVESGFKAEIDIPEQGAKALPLEAVRCVGPEVHFELPSPIGRAHFNGTLEGDKISGPFLQGAVKAKFQLERGPLKPPEVSKLPGVHREVQIARGDYALGGTLSLPVGAGPFPAVVMITGSGAQTRDEEVAGFAFFRHLAEHLLEQGIAVLRCDDRGVGASTGDARTVTTATNADDAEASFAFLRAQEGIDPARCGLLGHSEGGVIAPIVAARNKDVAFILLLAPSCVRGDELLFRQGELLLKAGGGTEAMAKAKRKLQQAVFAWMRTGEGRAELKVLIEEEALTMWQQMPAASRGDEKEFVASYAAQAVRTFDNPWMRHFIDFDPAATLRQVPCPTLALFGARDLQVPPSQSKPAIEAAFADRPALLQAETLPKANHLFQAAFTGGVQEYAILPKKSVEGLREKLSAFILALPRR